MDPRLQSPDADSGPSKIAPDFIDNSPILRQLFYDVKFRIGAAIFVAVLAAVALCIPKIFVATPPWVNPPMRVSLLNRLQAKSLMRTAVKQTDLGNVDNSMWAWQSALVLNPASVAINRGMLESLSRLSDPRRKYLRMAMDQIEWLLQLSATNQPDLELASQVYERYGADDQVVRLLAPMGPQLSPALTAELAKAYFRMGDIPAFAKWREKAKAGGAGDWHWELYDLAWQWGWGPPSGLNQAQTRMKAAQDDPQKAPLAHRLSLYVQFARADLDGFNASLRYLRDQHQDRVLDYANYWALLAQNGRTAEAKNLARQYSEAPSNPAEIVVLARQMRALDLTAEAARIVAQNLPNFSYASELWTLLADIYIDQKDWTRLRELGINLREDSVQRNQLPGFGWYLEGLADLKLHFDSQARDAFEHTVDATIKSQFIAYKTATELANLGYPDLSRKMLGHLEADFGNSGDYWFRLGIAAYEMEDYSLFLSASQKAYQLSPKSLAIDNNLAAALILLRDQPSLAVQLTLKCMAAEPANADFKINHVLALLMNSEYSEAEKLLKRIDADQLPLMQHSLVHFGWLQIDDAKGDAASCRQELEKIDSRFLKAEQFKWLQKARARFNPAPGEHAKNG